jgi:hypothetical protein
MGVAVGLEVLTAVSTKIAVFWVVTRRYNPEDAQLGVAVVACPKRTTRIDSVEESAEENNICS